MVQTPRNVQISFLPKDLSGSEPVGMPTGPGHLWEKGVAALAVPRGQGVGYVVVLERGVDIVLIAPGFPRLLTNGRWGVEQVVALLSQSLTRVLKSLALHGQVSVENKRIFLFSNALFYIYSIHACMQV